MTWQRLDYIPQPPAVKLISFCEKDYERHFHKGGGNKKKNICRNISGNWKMNFKAGGATKWLKSKWPSLDERLVTVGNCTATPWQPASVNRGLEWGDDEDLHANFREHRWWGSCAVCPTAALLLFSSGDVLAEHCCISKFLIYERFCVSPPVESWNEKTGSNSHAPLPLTVSFITSPRHPPT